jgi:GT2 family glycosyltransferase
LPLDADDKIHKDYLNDAINVFEKKTQVDVVYCEARLFGAVNRKWYLPPLTHLRLAKDNIVFCSAIIRRDIFDKVGGYDEQLIYGKEDWDFWISVYTAGGKFHRINKILFFYRIKKISRNEDFKKNHENNFFTNSVILKKHHNFFTEAMIQRMYEPLYLTVLNDIKSIFMYLYYIIRW